MVSYTTILKRTIPAVLGMALLVSVRIITNAFGNTLSERSLLVRIDSSHAYTIILGVGFALLAAWVLYLFILSDDALMLRRIALRDHLVILPLTPEKKRAWIQEFDQTHTIPEGMNRWRAAKAVFRAACRSLQQEDAGPVARSRKGIRFVKFVLTVLICIWCGFVATKLVLSGHPIVGGACGMAASFFGIVIMAGLKEANAKRKRR